MKRTVIVDNLEENFSLQPENGLAIKTWLTDPKDTALFQLAPLLLKIVENEGVDDVRKFLETQRLFNQELISAIAHGAPISN